MCESCHTTPFGDTSVAIESCVIITETSMSRVTRPKQKYGPPFITTPATIGDGNIAAKVGSLNPHSCLKTAHAAPSLGFSAPIIVHTRANQGTGRTAALQTQKQYESIKGTPEDYKSPQGYLLSLRKILN